MSAGLPFHSYNISGCLKSQGNPTTFFPPSVGPHAVISWCHLHANSVPCQLRSCAPGSSSRPPNSVARGKLLSCPRKPIGFAFPLQEAQSTTTRVKTMTEGRRLSTYREQSDCPASELHKSMRSNGFTGSAGLRTGLGGRLPLQAIVTAIARRCTRIRARRIDARLLLSLRFVDQRSGTR